MPNGISFFGSTIGSVGRVFKRRPTKKFTPPRTLDKTSRTFANGNVISSNTSTAGSSSAFLRFETGQCLVYSTSPPWNSTAYGFNLSVSPPSSHSVCSGWDNNINDTQNSRKATTGESAWSNFTENLGVQVQRMMYNSTNDYVGTFANDDLYATAVYGVGGAASAYEAGEFGPVGSIGAVREFDAIKGYMGREFLVKATLQGLEFDAIKGILDTAISDNNSRRVANFILDNSLTLGSSTATSAMVAFVANFLYQNTQAFAETFGYQQTPINNQPLYKNIIKELFSLGRQTLGSSSLTPPAWLNGKTYTGTLGNGDTVQYTFSSGSYVRQVNP